MGQIIAPRHSWSSGVGLEQSSDMARALIRAGDEGGRHVGAIADAAAPALRFAV